MVSGLRLQAGNMSPVDTVTSAFRHFQVGSSTPADTRRVRIYELKVSGFGRFQLKFENTLPGVSFYMPLYIYICIS